MLTQSVVDEIEGQAGFVTLVVNSRHILKPQQIFQVIHKKLTGKSAKVSAATVFVKRYFTAKRVDKEAMLRQQLSRRELRNVSTRNVISYYSRYSCEVIG